MFRRWLLEKPTEKPGLAAFTSPAESEKGEPCDTITFHMKTAVEQCLESDWAGCILNPWSKPFLLTNDLIVFLLDAGKNEKGENNNE